jgi:acetylornithine/N-succinyldiaminopimelate aminotransferase
MGALALTGKSEMQAPFLPMPGGVVHIDTTIEALEATIDDTVAALFLEPIKGEAGVIDLPEGYLAAARTLTEQHGVLLIIDEIQTGVGRTGRWFGFEHAEIKPDAITLAKGMAGGIPIGALVTFGWASELFQRGMHGSTFGGNPLATATANAVLGEIETAGLVDNAERKGRQLSERIAALNSPLIEEIRGKGLLIGLGLTEPIALKLAAAAMDAGLIINAANESSIRMAPPLIIRDLEVDIFITRFSAALTAVGYPPNPSVAE